MKKIFAPILVLATLFILSGCTSKKAETSTAVQPSNIDKNNVGITSGENPDQTDPTLIEGNLEDNDFKN